MNGPVAVLIAVSVLFAATWSRDGAGPRPERLVASRGYIETDVLAAARESAQETAHLVETHGRTTVAPLVEPVVAVEPTDLSEPVDVEPVEVVEPAIEFETFVEEGEAVPAAELVLPVEDWAKATVAGTMVVADRMTTLGDRAVASMRSTIVDGVDTSIRRVRDMVVTPFVGDALAVEPSDTARR